VQFLVQSACSTAPYCCALFWALFGVPVIPLPHSLERVIMATATTSRPRHEVAEIPPAWRSVSIADRIALRVGMALIVWSRRTHRPGLSADRARDALRARAAREAAWQRDATFVGRWR
jgi:hypothetical protein